MLNTINIMGRLVAEPEVRYNRDNKPFATFTIACDRDFDRDKTDFIDCISFGKTAGFVQDYFHKGDAILLKGSVQMSTWEDKYGQKRRDYKVVTEHVYFAGSKGNSSAARNSDGFTDVTDDGEEGVPF